MVYRLLRWTVVHRTVRLLEEAKNLIADDYAKDGELNANPERLTELANKARAAGNTKTAEFWEGQISETAYMKNSEQVLKNSMRCRLQLVLYHLI